MMALAGLPGRLKTTFVLRAPELSLKGTVAKVVGLPGFIETRPKWMVPPSERSSVGFSRSSSPMETPPEVMRTSVRRKASRIADSRAPGLFVQMLALRPLPLQSCLRIACNA